MALSRFGDVPPVASKGGTSYGQSRLYKAFFHAEPLPENALRTGRCRAHALRVMDPRWFQISALSGLLIYGMGWLSFEIDVAQAAVTLAAVLLTQFAGTRWAKLPAFDAKSALISGLSLCLLLRTNHLALAAAAGVVTIASKFLLRMNGKHLFNPTNFGLVAMMLATDGAVWVSPGQWGNIAFFAFLLACAGGLVVMRAERSDVTLAFIVSWIALVAGRSLWLGEPLAIPLHRLQSGALLLFTFFMISDPRTTPDARTGRIVFAMLVAWGAWYVQFRMFRTNGLLWSLAVFSLCTPMLDWLLPGARYRWTARPLFFLRKPEPALP